MSPSRALSLVALVALLGALALFVTERARLPIDDPDFTPLAPAGRAAFTTSESCRSCHPVIYEEWERSQHAFSPRDPVYSMFEATGMRVEPGNPECQRCHHPAPVFATPLGKYPRPRPEERDPGRGVTCLTCHALGDRTAAASTSDAPCRPQREPALRSSLFCAGCHQNQQVRLQRKHEYEEWLERSALTEEKTCVDCHMDVVERPIVPGGQARRSHVHSFPATRDSSFLQRAFTLDAQVLKGRVTLQLRNLGTGHRLPTGYRIRKLHIDARVESAEEPGRVLWEETYSLHREPRYGGANTQLADGEVRIVRFDPLPADVTSGVLHVTSELAYAPFQPPTRIHAIERPFPHAPLPLAAEIVPEPARAANDSEPAPEGPSLGAGALVLCLGLAFLALWLLGTLRRGA